MDITLINMPLIGHFCLFAVIISLGYAMGRKSSGAQSDSVKKIKKPKPAAQEDMQESPYNEVANSEENRAGDDNNKDGISLGL